MAIKPEEIKNLIKCHIPDASVHIVSLKDGNDYYEATVISPSFKGLSRLQQHRLVYKALGDVLHISLHAFSLKTEIPLSKGHNHESSN